ncbi:hypothetical protein NDU88_008499 [Pleurodeles waltl]|uniref:Uncharacterized protein n=1 Tax=Pleurodeles waltl TaxID=8319 RepID=A0AAV7PUI6_PLEWA|nr:hypothetical protein NDU88_008499 [Pleurodeles waltl]
MPLLSGSIKLGSASSQPHCSHAVPPQALSLDRRFLLLASRSPVHAQRSPPPRGAILSRGRRGRGPSSPPGRLLPRSSICLGVQGSRIPLPSASARPLESRAKGGEGPPGRSSGLRQPRGRKGHGPAGPAPLTSGSPAGTSTRRWVAGGQGGGGVGHLRLRLLSGMPLRSVAQPQGRVRAGPLQGTSRDGSAAAGPRPRGLPEAGNVPRSARPRVR